MFYTIKAETKDYEVEKGFDNKEDAIKAYNRLLKDDYTKIEKNWA